MESVVVILGLKWGKFLAATGVGVIFGWFGRGRTATVRRYGNQYIDERNLERLFEKGEK